MDRHDIHILEELRGFDAPTICNALERFNLRPRNEGFAMPGIIQRTKQQKPMIGYAVTAKVSAMHPPSHDSESILMSYYEKVAETGGYGVAVIQDTDPVPTGSFWGEVQATVHKSFGSVGTITAGGVRDIKEVDELGFYFFSTHMLVSHSYIHMLTHSCTVEICGLTVKPGDLLFADHHGVVCIPQETVMYLAEACRGIADAELPVLGPCREAMAKGEKITVAQLREWRGKMVAARNSVNPPSNG